MNYICIYIYAPIHIQYTVPGLLVVEIAMSKYRHII
jgi:hypothetical protein